MASLRFLRPASLLLLLGLAPAALVAQQNPPEDPVISFSAEGSAYTRADLKDADGKLQESTYGATAAWTDFAGEDSFRQVSFEVRNSHFEFSGDSLYRHSFNNVLQLQLSGTWQFPLVDRWNGLVSGGGLLAADNSEHLGRGWNVPFLAGVGYTFSKEFKLGLGLLGEFRANEDPFLFPYLGVEWRPTDRFTFYTRNGVFASYEAGGQRNWKLVSSATFTTFVFAVDNLKNFPGGKTRGVVEDRSYNLNLKVERTLFRQWVVTAGVTGKFGRKFRYLDDGNKFAEFKVDPSVGLDLGATYRF